MPSSLTIIPHCLPPAKRLTTDRPLRNWALLHKHVRLYTHSKPTQLLTNNRSSHTALHYETKYVLQNKCYVALGYYKVPLEAGMQSQKTSLYKKDMRVLLVNWRDPGTRINHWLNMCLHVSSSCRDNLFWKLLSLSWNLLISFDYFNLYIPNPCALNWQSGYFWCQRRNPKVNV